MRTVFLLSLALVLLFPQGSSAFSDVPAEHPYAEAIAAVESAGVVEGYPDGTYRPDETVNRAEFTKILVGAFTAGGSLDSCEARPFPDVSPGAWFAPFVCIARNRGMIGGYPDGTFRPERSINVAEASKVVTQAFGLSAGSGSTWYEPYVEALRSRGTLPPTSVGGTHLLTRGEMAFMISRLRTGTRSSGGGHGGDSAQLSPVPDLLQYWYDDTVRHMIPLNQIFNGGPRKDQIPSIDHPRFVTTQKARSYVEDEEPGILLTKGETVRYYPYPILTWHEIVNDTVEGVPVSVTYCPLCGTGVVYERTISEGTVEFGVSGMLYESNLLMYDRATESLWNQVTGTAVVGPLTGEELERVESDIVRFATVLSRYPEAEVLDKDDENPRPYSGDPYAGYFEKDSTMFPVQHTDSRLHQKELVYGIVVNGQAKAYVADSLREEGTVEDTVGGHDVRLAWHAGTEHLTVRDETAGEDIVPLPVFWFAWYTQYPETGLWRE